MNGLHRKYLLFTSLFVGISIPTNPIKAGDRTLFALDETSLEEDYGNEAEDEELFGYEEDTVPIAPPRYEITLEPVGVSVSPIIGWGTRAGYYLSDNVVLEIDYGRGVADLFDMEVKSELFVVQGRYFWGPFYYYLGAGSKNIRSTHLSSASFSDESSISTLVVSGGLGIPFEYKANENFVASLDLFGLNSPVKLLRVRGDDPRTEDDFFTSDDDEKEYQNLAFGRTLQLLRLHFGARF